jgi:F0F1-type ATP synthase membrane subunit c/vacuolar-type H+-ATPase subunit K
VFGIVVGIALLLSGIGFGILAVGGALRNRDSALAHLQSHGSADASTATA